VTESAELRSRRELLVLAAELQRANVVRRFEHIEANPARKIFGLAAGLAARPAALTIGTAMARLALRTLRRSLPRR
jgi:hypothetical protein